MDDWLIILNCDVDVFTFEELGQMNPIVLLLLKFETVIKLVHLNLLGVVPLEDLSEDPPIGEIPLRICDLVRQVQRLDPLVELTGQSLADGVDGECDLFGVQHFAFNCLNIYI